MLMRKYTLTIPALLVALSACGVEAQRTQDPWQEAEAIVRRITPPTFPQQDFMVTAFGANGDGATDCSAAFAGTIAECARKGGGRVVVPSPFQAAQLHFQLAHFPFQPGDFEVHVDVAQSGQGLPGRHPLALLDLEGGTATEGRRDPPGADRLRDGRTVASGVLAGRRM